MTTPILLKRSSVASKVPLTTDLALGELAVNSTDGKLFMKKSVAGVESIVQVGESGGASYQVGQVFVGTSAPSSGTWLKTNGYYSKSAYPALASTLGSIPDFGTPADNPRAHIPISFSISSSVRNMMANNGTVAVLGSLSTPWRVSTDGLNWRNIKPTMGIYAAYDVQYLNGYFIVVGNSQNFAVSTDGYNWTRIFSGNSASYHRTCAYGAGRWVVGGASGNIQYSSDCSTFTGVPPLQAVDINRIIYANGIFVAIGNTGYISTSPNGIDWALRTPPAAITVVDIVYAAGLFVACTSTNVWTSPDGITWTARTLPTPSGTNSEIAYENNLFILSNSVGIFTSIDGITWSSSYSTGDSGAMPASTKWTGTQFLSVGYNGFYFTSSNGFAWTKKRLVGSANSCNAIGVFNGNVLALGTAGAFLIESPSSNNLPKVLLPSGVFPYTISNPSATNTKILSYGNGLYVTVGANGTIMTSPDAINWTGRTYGNQNASSLSSYLDKSYYLNGRFFVLGGSTSVSNIITSVDGITWTEISATGLQFNQIPNAMAYGNSTWVVVGGNSIIQYSTTGTSMAVASVSQSLSTGFVDVAFGNNAFVTITALQIFSSPDGVTWTSRYSAAVAAFTRVIFDNNMFVAINNQGKVFVSTDGITWQQYNIVPTSSSIIPSWNAIVWNGQKFCMVGSNGASATSTNGSSWTVSINQTTATLSSVSWNGSVFLATSSAANQAWAWVSSDGLTWSRYSTTANTTTILHSAYLNNKFITVGANHIQSSPDGIQWTQANTNQYVVDAGSQKFQFLNGMYYYGYSQGLYQSTDGINFTWSNQIPAQPVVGLAYLGSAWYLVTHTTSFGIASIFKSTDGTSWTKTATFGTNAKFPSVLNSVSLSATNTLLVLGIGADGSQGVNSGIYTSTDGITWTEKKTPNKSTPNISIATSPTTIMYSQADALSVGGTYKSTDGGNNWTLVSGLRQQPPVYYSGGSSGVWFNGGSWSADEGTTWSASNIASSSVITITGNYISGLSTNYKQYGNLLGNGSSVDMPFSFSSGFLLSAQYKEFPIRGDTILASINSFSALGNWIVEIPKYSYDTQTTFFVPPVASWGMIAYICAGA